MPDQPARRPAGALAATVAALALSYGAPAGAAVIATLTEVGSNPITVSSDLISCSSCVAYGANTYNFSAGATLAAATGPATSYLDGYDQEGFGFLGGSLSIKNATQTLLSGTFSAGTAYAVVGASSATAELDITGASSTVLSLPVGVLYFDVTGSTPAPVGLDAQGDFTIGAIDWTATLSTTPFTPSSAVPLPSSAALLLAGIAALGLFAARRSRTLASA